MSLKFISQPFCTKKLNCIYYKLNRICIIIKIFGEIIIDLHRKLYKMPHSQRKELKDWFACQHNLEQKKRGSTCSKFKEAQISDNRQRQKKTKTSAQNKNWKSDHYQ